MKTEATVHSASTIQDIRRCYPLMTQLRPHLQDEERFIEQVQRQFKTQLAPYILSTTKKNNRDKRTDDAAKGISLSKLSGILDRLLFLACG